MKKRILISLVFLVFFTHLFQFSLWSCTVGVASGKATIDGRPLLWKNRDSSGFENYVRYFISNGYSYLGLFSRGVPSSMYGGINERGFAIMNSVAYDLGKTGGYDNGRLMKKALEECGSVDEFEMLLKEVMGKYDLAANFGVIDSYGNAMIFETSSNSFKKYDASKSEKGYILRTNFSFSGGGKVGIRRFEREKEIFEKELKGKLDVNFLLKKVFRDVKDENGEIFDYKRGYRKGEKRFYNTKNSICRPYSVSSMIFRGVRADEPEYLSTFYIILGNPLTGSVIPLWVAAGRVPKLVEDYKHSPLNFEQMKIYSYLYPHNKKYTLDVSYLAGKGSVNLIPKIFNIENSILKESEDALEGWRRSFPGREAIASFQDYIAKKLYKNYKKLNKELYYFNLKKKIKLIPFFKIKREVISNFLAGSNKIIYITKDKKLNIFNVKTKKIKKIKIREKINENILIETGFSGAFYLLSGNKIIEKNNLFKTVKINKIYEFKGYDKYLKGENISFFVRVRNNLLLGLPQKHIIVSIDLIKKKITKKAGKIGISGFRDGTSSLSLLSDPYSAFKNTRDELIFTDRKNNTLRSLTQSNVIFTILGNSERGKETGWKEEVKIEKPAKICEINNGNILLTTAKGLRIIDDDSFSTLLINSEEFSKEYDLIPFKNKIFLYKKKKRLLYRLAF